MKDLLEFINNLEFIDGDLELVFDEERKVSEPDEKIVAYYFDIRNRYTREKMGFINFKNGFTDNIIMYRGNIGYEVFEKYRGNSYSSRSCILLKPLIRHLGFNEIFLTCNFNNYSSKKNIEKIGAKLIETVSIEENNKFSSYYSGDSRIKLRYRWNIF